ncbi:hypothetical protein SARC_09630 [Sphaeroforma arctica JP610]|uniref:Uncharacterized protein n=1 Tax=Sphaeroforma arctica JP610 TaxID=667725 RepID=A0A0L0FMC2_9EUKA|nr:hypothetical protein SARC_09630 [Sphaeroforma arctica JP610]KNC77917.1 hypothetical protein SARC_09630 [Sphaeroforma arctica JP610]|eukprot:XP_014151819.1 hypothetical protein SARC_09630 [Sphaeroforma arctica JP610]
MITTEKSKDFSSFGEEGTLKGGVATLHGCGGTWFICGGIFNPHKCKVGKHNYYVPYLAWRPRTSDDDTSDDTTVNDDSLQYFHGGCTLSAPIRSSECVAAAANACTKHYPGTSGMIQEVGATDVMVVCFQAVTVQDFEISQLTEKHEGCTSVVDAQKDVCVAAQRRICDKSAVAQQLGASVIGTACFNAGLEENVLLSDLTALHEECNSVGRSQDSSTATAKRKGSKADYHKRLELRNSSWPALPMKVRMSCRSTDHNLRLRL